MVTDTAKVSFLMATDRLGLSFHPTFTWNAVEKVVECGLHCAGLEKPWSVFNSTALFCHETLSACHSEQDSLTQRGRNWRPTQSKMVFGEPNGEFLKQIRQV